MIACVCDVEAAGGIKRETERVAQAGRRGGAAIAREAGRPVAGHGRDHARGVHRAHALVQLVRDEHDAGAVHGQPGDRTQARLRRLAAVAYTVRLGCAAAAPAGERGDHAPGIDPPDAVVRTVGDVEVTGAITGHVHRQRERSGDRRPAIAVDADHARSGDSIDAQRDHEWL